MIEQGTTKEDLIGKKLRVEKNTGMHNYGPKGAILYVNKSTAVNNNTITGAIKEDGTKGNSILFSEVSIVDESISGLKKDKDKLIEDKIDIEDKICNIDEKIEFMKVQGLSKFNEEEYKVFKVLQELKTYKTDMELAKSVAKIIK